MNDQQRRALLHEACSRARANYPAGEFEWRGKRYYLRMTIFGRVIVEDMRGAVIVSGPAGMLW